MCGDSSCIGVSLGIRPQPELTLMAGPNAPRLAYAVPVLAGLMVTLWFR